MDINYEGDWAGEQRTDPSDGNTFVLRAIAYRNPDLPTRGFQVQINDIMGGHSMWIDAHEWCSWASL